MKIKFLNLERQYLSLKSEIDLAISQVIENSSFIKGEFVNDFENKFSKLNKAKHCLSVANGTDALYISLKTLGVSYGDEIILPAHTWISTAEVIVQLGAQPVFVEVDDFFTIDTNKIQAKITNKTKCIIAVNLFGQMCDMSELAIICKKNNLFLVEDCAQAHFSMYNNTYAGLHGDIGAFSFYPGKNLGAFGDAGAIITNNSSIEKRARMFANHGGLKKHEHKIFGINSRMDGIQAAVLSVKLRYILDWNQKRINIANIYNHNFSRIKEIELPFVRKNTTHTFHQYVIKTKKRDSLRKFLFDNGIDTLIHYPKALPFISIFNQNIANESDFEKSLINQNEMISLPIYPELNEEELNYIILKIKQFFSYD
jgi:dTDP-4-amino-4,6-dideoxygalactose transaminase